MTRLELYAPQHLYGGHSGADHARPTLLRCNNLLRDPSSLHLRRIHEHIFQKFPLTLLSSCEHLPSWLALLRFVVRSLHSARGRPPFPFGTAASQLPSCLSRYGRSRLVVSSLGSFDYQDLVDLILDFDHQIPLEQRIEISRRTKRRGDPPGSSLDLYCTFAVLRQDVAQYTRIPRR